MGPRHHNRRLWIALALPVALAAIASPAYGGAFPGGNGEIAFSRGVLGPPGGVDLYAVGPDGSRPTQLTSSGGATDTSPAYSSDGTRIAFSRNENIYVIDADGSDLEQLTRSGTDSDPSFSPDGEQIVFSRIIRPSALPATESISAIFVMDANGSNATQLSHPPFAPQERTGPSDIEPTYSPGGGSIAFTRADLEFPTLTEPQVYIIDEDGSDETKLTSMQQASGPSFSPNGEQIAFAGQQAENFDIYVMDRDGTDPRRVTSDPAVEDQPAFSPDGTQIAFRRPFSIYAIGADGGAERQLTSGNMDSMPDWRPLIGLGGVPTCRRAPAPIVGTSGDDRLSGTPGRDVIAALGGDDRVKSGTGRDVVCAGGGKDRVRGGKGRDRLFGGKGADRIKGQAGSDVVRGGRARDRLRGGAGGDRLAGGKGRDRCRGGAGADDLRGC